MCFHRSMGLEGIYQMLSPDYWASLEGVYQVLLPINRFFLQTVPCRSFHQVCGYLLVVNACKRYKIVFGDFKRLSQLNNFKLRVQFCYKVLQHLEKLPVCYSTRRLSRSRGQLNTKLKGFPPRSLGKFTGSYCTRCFHQIIRKG